MAEATNLPLAQLKMTMIAIAGAGRAKVDPAAVVLVDPAAVVLVEAAAVVLVEAAAVVLVEAAVAAVLVDHSCRIQRALAGITRR